jgi:hypothetical protein
MDLTTSAHYKKLIGQYPQLAKLRTSVGQTYDSNGRLGGSAVLLDQSGTLVSTGHQSDSFQIRIGFLPTPQRELSFVYATATLIAKDIPSDTSFWQLDDPGVIRVFGLKPIKWGAIGASEPYPGELIIYEGFPGTAKNALDAELNRVDSYKAHSLSRAIINTPHGASEVLKISACKYDAVGKANSGVSGGPAFDIEGDFKGIVTAGGPDSDISRFTPVNALWNGYVRLVPAGQQHRDKLITQRHPECDIGNARAHTPSRRKLFTVQSKS